MRRTSLGMQFIAFLIATFPIWTLAAGLEIVSESRPEPRSDQRDPGWREVFHFSASPSGGFLIAGRRENFNYNLSSNRRKFNFWIVKTDNKGTPQWEAVIPHGLAANFAAAASGGGYWVGGYTGEVPKDPKTYEPLTPLIAKLREGGSVEWTYPQTVSRDETVPMCGADVGDGLAVVGRKRTPRYRLDAPWVAKISSQGKLIWEVLVEEIDKELATVRLLWENGTGCSGPHADKNGAIALAIAIDSYKREEVIEAERTRSPLTDNPRRDVLLLKINAKGVVTKEMRLSGEHLGARWPKFFATAQGYLLIDSVKADAKSVLGRAVVLKPGFIRVTNLDTELNVVEQRAFNLPEFEYRLDSAIPDASGALYLLGEPFKSNSRKVGLLRKDGTLGAVLDIGFSASHSALLTSTRSDELVLFLGSYSNGAHIARIKVVK